MRRKGAEEGLPVGAASVILLADHNDVGIKRLESTLAVRMPVIWWRFGLSESLVSVDVSSYDFCLEQPGAILRSSDLREADIIIYKRRVHQPTPYVVSEWDREADRIFAEREWTSLIEGLLLAEEAQGHAVWLNLPSVTRLTANKFSLILRAARDGINIPEFRVSNPVVLPKVADSGIVTKAISTDEQIDASRYLTTTLVAPEVIARIAGARLGTPPLLQRYVEPALELRVFLVLDEIITYALKPSAEHVDIRHITAAEMAPRPYELDRELSIALRRYAARLKLRYCTFDIILSKDGLPALVDITPNGAWDYFESESNPAITIQIAEVIEAHVIAASKTRNRHAQ